jgi:hypothetical protein
MSTQVSAQVGGALGGHRQAALALFGLAARDQALILAELDLADQQVLRDYLAELAALGFDGTPLESAASASVTPSPAATTDAFTRLRMASASAMVGVLAGEPASLTAQVLSLERWAWAPDFIDGLAAPARKQVRDALQDGVAVAPALRAFLLDAVADGLPASPAAAPARAGWRARIAESVAWIR